jgi:predicted dehydrogenase
MLNWGIIGTGQIARVFCNAMRFSKTGRVIAVGGRSQEKADKVADDFSIHKRVASYEELLADNEVEAVYISTIHPAHAEWTIKAAAAGKHILVEKPIGMNVAEAQSMIEAAQQNDVFLMEAFMYRCHPQTAKVVQLVKDGAVGQVRMIRAVLSFHAPYDPASRLYARELGGGGIMDVGCYPASGSRLIAGAAAGKPFLDPVEVKGTAHLGPTRVDHYASASVRFENGVVAELICGVNCEVPGEVHIYGSEGMLTIPNLWLPSSPVRNATKALSPDTPIPPATMRLDYHDGRPSHEFVVEADRDLYAYEADTVAEYIDARQAPAVSWEDSLSNMRLLDSWRKEVALTYDADRRPYA